MAGGIARLFSMSAIRVKKVSLIRIIKSVRIAKGTIESLLRTKSEPSGKGAVSLLFFYAIKKSIKF